MGEQERRETWGFGEGARLEKLEVRVTALESRTHEHYGVLGGNLDPEAPMDLSALEREVGRQVLENPSTRIYDSVPSRHPNTAPQVPGEPILNVLSHRDLVEVTAQRDGFARALKASEDAVREKLGEIRKLQERISELEFARDHDWRTPGGESGERGAPFDEAVPDPHQQERTKVTEEALGLALRARDEAERLADERQQVIEGLRAEHVLLVDSVRAWAKAHAALVDHLGEAPIGVPESYPDGCAVSSRPTRRAILLSYTFRGYQLGMVAILSTFVAIDPPREPWFVVGGIVGLLLSVVLMLVIATQEVRGE
jgi:hypothetical protein